MQANVLITIPISHYCEKARWALDRARQPYVEVRHLPLFHWAHRFRFTLVDLGSTNGTFHNEEAIGFQGRRELRDGDKVRFGGYSVAVFNIAARI